MGYTFKIGNLKVEKLREEYTDDETGVTEVEEYESYDTDSVVLDEAPIFPNDGLTGQSNARHPSYSAWSGFCDSTGIIDVFYDGKYVRGGHPGYFDITQDVVDAINNAVTKYKKNTVRQPGFDGFPIFDPLIGNYITPDEDKYDANYARLLWLEFWVNWAFKNCKKPVIVNW